MAKTESTAVNKLIELVATQKPLPPDPDEDLMFREPAQSPPSKKTTRMGATVPPIKGAGEVAPLPHTRAASGTQSGLPVVPPPVRVSTAPPSRSATIPPLQSSPASSKQTLMGPGPEMILPPAATLPPAAPNPSKQTLMGTLPPTNLGSIPPTPAADLRSTLMGPAPGPGAEPHRPSRPTKPSLPPPRPSGPPVPFQPRATLPPSAPIAAPFEASPPPAHLPTSDEPFADAPVAFAATAFPGYEAPEHLPPENLPEIGQGPEWYGATLVDQSGEPWVGTARVPKQSDWKSIAGKLIGPMLGLVVLGIFIGGYFAFDGEGGRKTGPASAPAKKVEANAPVKPVLGDSAKAVAGEAAKNEAASTASSDTASTDTAHSEVAKTEPTKTEPAHSEPAATDTAHSEVAHSEPAKTEPVKTEPAKTEPAKTEPVKTEPPKTEPPKTEHAPAPTKVATAEPAVVTPPNLAANHAAPTGMVDIRIDTKPAGATVMLVDRGRTMFLGTAPISTSLDASRKYDLVFTYASKPTQVEHLDPTTTKHVVVVLGTPGNQAGKTVAAPKTETKAVPASSAPRAEAPKTEKTEKTEKVEKPAPVRVAKAEKAANDESIKKGQGTLMISSKPPCEIIVDGKPTGLTTPQRAIPLAAGTHKVTLVNSAENISKTVAITITADQPTKVIQDLMQK